MKKITFVFLPFIMIAGLSVEVHGHNQPRPLPDPQVTQPPEDWLLTIFVNNHFRIGGIEAGASTYGYSVGLPVFWVQDQLKLVPTLGWFWQTRSGWSNQGVLGAKALYFLNKQKDLSKREMNPYIGGFTMVDGDSYHNSGIAIGFEPNISRYLKLGFEIQAGLRSHNGEDRTFGGAAITVGFGW